MRQTEMFLGSSVLSKQKQKESDLKVSHLSMSLAHHIEQTLLLDFHLIQSRNLLLFQILLTSLTESLLNVKDQHVQPSLTAVPYLGNQVVLWPHHMAQHCSIVLCSTTGCVLGAAIWQCSTNRHAVYTVNKEKKNTQIYN